MKTIYKYPLRTEELQFVKLPIGAEILCVKSQANDLCLWALVDNEAETEDRCFVVLPTGSEIKSHTEDLKYIDTVLWFNGTLVFHVFEYTGHDRTTRNPAS